MSGRHQYFGRPMDSRLRHNYDVENFRHIRQFRHIASVGLLRIQQNIHIAHRGTGQRVGNF